MYCTSSDSRPSWREREGLLEASDRGSPRQENLSTAEIHRRGINGTIGALLLCVGIADVDPDNDPADLQAGARRPPGIAGGGPCDDGPPSWVCIVNCAVFGWVRTILHYIWIGVFQFQLELEYWNTNWNTNTNIGIWIWNLNWIRVEMGSGHEYRIFFSLHSHVFVSFNVVVNHHPRFFFLSLFSFLFIHTCTYLLPTYRHTYRVAYYGPVTLAEVQAQDWPRRYR